MIEFKKLLVKFRINANDQLRSIQYLYQMKVQLEGSMVKEIKMINQIRNTQILYSIRLGLIVLPGGIAMEIRSVLLAALKTELIFI